MFYHYCYECGSALTERSSANDGLVPYCPKCGRTRHPHYNVAVSMIVREEGSGRILLIRQYGKPSYILVAGYVNRGESEETAVLRELKEETGLSGLRLQFNRTKFFEPSNTLMCNFTVWIRSADELAANDEIDSCAWFLPQQARREIRPNSLAAEFLELYLRDSGEC